MRCRVTRALVLLLLLLAPRHALAFEPPVFVAEFGQAQPHGPETFGYNSGIAVDAATGDVYVTDPEHLFRFDQNGNPLGSWPCSGCRGLDVNPVTGDVYVARIGTHQISRFRPDGTLVGVIGGIGSGPGQFLWPHDVAVDPATGNIYVMDVRNARVQQLDANGGFIREWGTVGGADGQFSGVQSPGGIAFDATNRKVYTSDPPRDAIQKFDASGGFEARWETTESPCGCQSPDQLRWIRHIAVDGAGRLLVADADGERVSVFDGTGAFVTSFQGPHDVASGPFHPRGVAVNPTSGHVYVSAAYAQRVDHFDGGHRYLESWGDRERDGPTLWEPWGLAVSPVTGDVYVFAGLQFRVKRFSLERGFLGEWGESARLLVSGQPIGPEGLFGSFRNAIATDDSGNVWVFVGGLHYEGDPVHYSVQQFDPSGRFLSGWLVPDTFGNTGAFRDGFVDTSRGQVFISDITRNRVLVHDLSGVLLHEIPGLKTPAGLAVHGSRLFVAQAGTDTIVEFQLDPAPTLVAEWAGPGSGPGKLDLNARSGIAISPGGHIFVADTGNHRIQVFDLGGGFLGGFGGRGSGPGQFRNPMDVGIGLPGLLHVADATNRRVQSFLVDLLLECGDGLDNDANGLVDAADPGCRSSFDRTEGRNATCGLGGEVVAIVAVVPWLRRFLRRRSA